MMGWDIKSDEVVFIFTLGMIQSTMEVQNYKRTVGVVTDGVGERTVAIAGVVDAGKTFGKNDPQGPAQG